MISLKNLGFRSLGRKISEKELLALLVVSVVFVASCVVLMRRDGDGGYVVVEGEDVERVVVESPLPVLGDRTSFPELSAQGVLVVDANSGVRLYEKNPDLILLPASTTKIMTALVALENYNLEDVFVVGREAIVEGQKMGLVVGEEISVDALVKGLLIFSANDAAEVLANSYPEGRAGFVERMNQKASELSMENTTFTNPTGFDDAGHVSTAKDLVRLSQIAMEDGYFREVVGIEKLEVASADGGIRHRLVNINKLVGSVEGVKGVKTGWTEVARENLVSYVERDGRRVYIALLGSQDRFGETVKLIDWVFKQFRWEDVVYYSS